MSKFMQATISGVIPKLVTVWKYGKTELRPPSPGEMVDVRKGFNNLMSAIRQKRWKQVPVREAWLNTMVGLEIAFWFYVGEAIGRGNLYGYIIPGH